LRALSSRRCRPHRAPPRVPRTTRRQVMPTAGLEPTAALRDARDEHLARPPMLNRPTRNARRRRGRPR
jgi:hypothetical protein